VSLTTDTLQTKVDFLLEASSPGATRGSTASTTIMRKLIVGMPTLLYLSIDNNLSPKVEYLQQKLGSEELSSALGRQPTLLAYSLEKRIKPRLEKILEAGVDGGSLTVGIPMKEEAFESWLQGRARKAKLGVTKSQVRKKRQKEVKSKKETKAESKVESKGDGEKRVVQEGGRIVHWVRGT
jgi:mTERF domain-containing protein